MSDNDGLMDHAMDRVNNRGTFVIDVDGLSHCSGFSEIVCQEFFQGKSKSEYESFGERWTQ